MKLKNQRHLYYLSLEILILLAIIFICFKLSFLFKPIQTFINAVFIPILIAGILYYLLNPIKKQLMKLHIKKHYLNRTGATSIIFIVGLILIYLILAHFIPMLIHQISNLISNAPQLSHAVERTARKYSHYGILKHLPIKSYVHRTQLYFTHNTTRALTNITGGLSNIISMATNVLINIITIPFMLFYMLKDGYKFQNALGKILPSKHRKRSLNLLTNMSNTISKYIDGQLIECLFVGFFTMVGFLLIHQPYAILLGLFGGMCVIIPYVGPYIGIAPAICVALTVNVSQAIWVIIVVIIVEQIDGNVIYPNVIGKSLQIHPLTIIIILLAAGHLSGMLGMILAVPLYAVIKTIVVYLHNVIAISHLKD